MAFGNNNCQNRPDYPAGNNYCGGFALCAILNDINSEKGVPLLEPLAVYNQVQEKQKGLEGYLKDIIGQRKNDSGTDICLPSSLARCAVEDYHVKNPILLYSSEWSMPVEVIQASGKEYPYMDIVGIDDWQSRINNDYKHFLFLVQDDNHWIAVKRKDDGNFLVYDPADGNEVEKDKAEIASYLMDTKNDGKPINLVIYFEK